MAVGDPWYLDYAQDELGKSLVLVRTELGKRALKQAYQKGEIALQENIPLTDISNSQQGILRRRFYSSARIRWAALWAKASRDVAHTLLPFPLNFTLRTGRGLLRFLIQDPLGFLIRRFP